MYSEKAIEVRVKIEGEKRVVICPACYLHILLSTLKRTNGRCPNQDCRQKLEVVI